MKSKTIEVLEKSNKLHEAEEKMLSKMDIKAWQAYLQFKLESCRIEYGLGAEYTPDLDCKTCCCDNISVYHG